MQFLLNNPKKSYSVLNKGYIVIYFFVFIFVFSIVMAILLSTHKTSKDQNTANVSRFEAFDFEYYRISQEGVESFVVGKKIQETNRGQGQLEHVNAINYIFESKSVEFLQSSFALFDEEKITFPKGVNYVRDSLKFWSKEAIYYPDNKEIIGKGDFIVFSENYNIRGENILYKNNKVYANEVNGVLQVDKQ